MKLHGLVLLLLAGLAPVSAEACRPFGSYTFVEDKARGIWFTEGDNNAVSRLAQDGTIKSFRLPTPNAEPSSLALDRRGNIWLVESDAAKIGRLGRDGKIVEYATTDGHPVMVAVDSKGEAWFTQMAGNHAPDQEGEHAGHGQPFVSKVGRIAAGRMTGYPLDEGWPTSIAIDRSDRVWVSVLVPGDTDGRKDRPVGKLARLDRDGRWTFVHRWENSCPSNLLAVPGGGLIISDHCRGVIGRLDRNGKLAETVLPPNTSIQQMSLARDGTLWFTTAEGGRIGRITHQGKVAYANRPENGDDAFAILATRSGDVVFSEFYNYNINRLTKSGEFVEHLVNLDARHDGREAREGEVCLVKFASRIVDKQEMDRRRAEEVRLGRLKPTADGVERLAEQKCLSCHDARRLLLSRRSDWSPSIGRMQEYMRVRNVPRLTDDEKQILVRYFNTHYGLN
ncbi:virginiamycin B lyase family protein [Sulfuricella sp.]|uniref:Vgb family protein n=1 Tax=Sulfuricella sp. TaxID=2099377 RepID=UPI002BB8B41F|nr:hypothetical protein [Sulfuricella sp.]HUX64075.1 hypothetical protein [Sulfuricella sp.]